jgi:hypothetical protein
MEKTMAKSISVQRLQQFLNEEEKPCLLDVRRQIDMALRKNAFPTI